MHHLTDRTTRFRGSHLPLFAALSIFVVAGLAMPKAQAANALAKPLWQERAPASQSNSAAANLHPNFRNVAQNVLPAVVSISVETQQRSTQRSGQRSGPMQRPEDFLFRYFGGQPPPKFRNRGLGTGFVIRQDGLILTNNHVVENAEHIEVTFADSDGNERKMAAKLLGSAPNYDVALLQTQEDAGAAVAPLGHSSQMEIGDWVMAIGNPFGLSHSASVGIISAKERRHIAPSGRHGLYNFLQTDASINPGNSGGPLLNGRGEVIGINTAINASGAGIGFAIPIDMVKKMLPELKSKGRFSRSWIGIQIQGLDKALAESYGLTRPQGALVAQVMPDSPAAKAKLQEGDLILAFDDKPVRQPADIQLFASLAGVGTRVQLKILRQSKKLTIPLVLAAFRDNDTKLGSAHPNRSTPAENHGFGLRVRNLTPELARRMRLGALRGVVVQDIAPSSPAAQAGLQSRDLVLSANGQKVADAQGFAAIAGKIRPKGVLRLQILRPQDGGAPRKLFVALRKNAKKE